MSCLLNEQLHFAMTAIILLMKIVTTLGLKMLNLGAVAINPQNLALAFQMSQWLANSRLMTFFMAN